MKLDRKLWEIAEEYENKVKVCKVDVDEVESLAYKYNVRSIPMLLYFDNGKYDSLNKSHLLLL